MALLAKSGSRTNLRSRSIASGFAALFVLAATGCGSDANRQPATIESVRAPRFEYMTSDRESALYFAIQTRVQSCMKAKGFDYDFPSPSGEDLLVYLPLLPFGTDDVANAIANGYGNTEGTPLEATSQTTAQTAEYVVALVGTQEQFVQQGQISVPGAGCVYDGFAELFEDPVRYQVLRSERINLGNEAVSIARADDGVLKALARYKSCMSSDGFGDAIDPEAARELAANAESSAIAHQIAVSDAQCNSESDLRSIGEGVFAVAYESLYETKAADFDLLKSVEDRALSLVEV